MTRRAWLPHPARHNIGRPPTCPIGDRFTTRNHALDALTHGLGPHGLHTVTCPQGCGGWHNLPRTQPSPSEPSAAADCDPNWRDTPDEYDRLCEIGAREFHGHTGIHYRDIATVTAPEEYL